MASLASGGQEHNQANPSAIVRNTEMEAHQAEKGTLPTQEQLRELYDRLKPAVWFIKFKGYNSNQRQDVEVICTGFCIDKSGLVLTCSHDWPHLVGLVIHARRLTDDKLELQASVPDLERKWDLALLQIDGLKGEVETVEFAQTGKIEVGDLVLHIGNSANFVASFLMGRAAYRCIDGVVLPTGFKACRNYDTDTDDKTPAYRIMGHVINSKSLKKNNTRRDDFEGNLHPDVPIIQCNGLTCGFGSSGGPLFNASGKLIAMLNLDSAGFEVGVHMSLLRAFINRPPEDRKGLVIRKAEDEAAVKKVDTVAGTSRVLGRGSKKRKN